jgi:hypothetical protein
MSDAVVASYLGPTLRVKRGQAGCIVSRRRARQPRRAESVVLAIADIELAEALLAKTVPP